MGCTLKNKAKYLGGAALLMSALAASGCAGTADLAIRDPSAGVATEAGAPVVTADNGQNNPGSPGAPTNPPNTPPVNPAPSGILADTVGALPNTLGAIVDSAGDGVQVVGAELSGLDLPLLSGLGDTVGGIGETVSGLGSGLQQAGWNSVPLVGGQMTNAVATLDGNLNQTVAVGALDLGGGTAPIGVNALSAQNAQGAALNVDVASNGNLLGLTANGAQSGQVLNVSLPLNTTPTVGLLGQTAAAPVSGGVSLNDGLAGLTSNVAITDGVSGLTSNLPAAGLLPGATSTLQTTTAGTNGLLGGLLGN